MRRAAVILLLAAAAGAGGLEWKRGSSDWYKPRDLVLSAQPPEGVQAVGEGALYYAGTLGDKKLLFALEPATGLLRVDRDFDGDLSDETAVPLMPEPPWLRRVVEVDMPDPVAFSLRRREGETEPKIELAILAHREGTIVVDGRARRVLLLDGDQDLRFDHPEDTVLLDLDGNGELDRADAAERIVPGRPFRMRGKSFVATLEGPGGCDLSVVLSAVATAARPVPWRAEYIPPPRVAPGLKRTIEQLADDYEADRSTGWGRAQILRQAGALGTPEAFAFLWKACRRESDDDLVLAAVEAMGYKNFVDHAREVASVARASRPPPIRCAALDALHLMDAPDRGDVLSKLLSSDEDEAVFAAAARNLGYLGTEDARRLLEEAALRAGRVAYRYHAYYAATRYRSVAPPAELVLGAAKQADPRLKAVALRDALKLELPEARELALEAAKSEKLTPELRLAVTEALGASGDAEAVRAMLPFADGATPALRGRLLDLLRAVRDELAVQEISMGLDHAAPPVRALCADVLREIPGAPGAALVARLKKERQEPALTALIRAVGQLKLEDAAGPVADALRRRPDDLDFEQTALWALARIGVGNPVVATFLSERLASPDAERRLSAVDCLVASGDPMGATLLAPRLLDSLWQVRFAAAMGLGVVRLKASVPPLIAALAKEDRVRVRKAIAESLFRLTGEDLGDSYELWERWFKDHGSGFEVPAKVPQRNQAAAKGERRTVAFYGVPVDSTRVAFVLDISSSMGGSGYGREPTELDRAVQETLKVVKAMPSEARINVILFETEITMWKRSLTPLGAATRKALETFLLEQKPRGTTNLFDALESALQLKDVDTIYLLSDGSPTCGRLTDEEEILAAVRQLNREKRAAIHCVALGGGSRLLRRLSEMTLGTYTQR